LTLVLPLQKLSLKSSFAFVELVTSFESIAWPYSRSSGLSNVLSHPFFVFLTKSWFKCRVLSLLLSVMLMHVFDYFALLSICLVLSILRRLTEQSHEWFWPEARSHYFLLERVATLC
jgi:type III secretory pathway component EscU